MIPFLNDPVPEVQQCAAPGLAARPEEAAASPSSGHGAMKMGCRESGGERTGQDRGERLSPPRLSS